jgi:SAM-dependent methyltransferase
LGFCREIFATPSPMAAILINDAAYGLRRVAPLLAPLDRGGARVLEVGAGCLILSAYLAARGFRVTSLEPLPEEFGGVFFELQQQVLAHCAARKISLELVTQAAEIYVALDRFDVVFTIQALEHMPNPYRALDNMYASLAPGGVLLANCPNYDVPYENHIEIVLVTRSKRVNELVYPGRTAARREFWNGLTFIRYSQLRRYLVARGMAFVFDHTMLREAFTRLGEDSLFSARRGSAARRAYHILRSLGLIRLLNFVPLRFQTPMEVLIRK